MNVTIQKTWPHRRSSKLLSGLALLVILLLLLAPSAQAQQETSLPGGYLGRALIGSAVQVFASITSAFLAWVGSIFDSILRIQVDVTVVRQLWQVTRDFANMFFILLIIIMAFATIFDIGSFGYSGYDWKSMLVRFIIAAVLINFSLVIGEVLIDASQTVTEVFLNAIGDSSNKILAGVVTDVRVTGEDQGWINSLVSTVGSAISSAGGFLNNPLIQIIGSLARAPLTWSAIIQLFFNGMIFALLAVSIFSVILFVILRVFVLWFLLIVSPIAWITFIVPKWSGVNKKWWDKFISWNVFLPIYMFFLYLGLFMLSNQSTLMSRLWAPGTQSTVWESVTLGAGLSIQSLFSYALIVFIMWAGSGLAFSISATAGVGGVRGWTKATRYATARVIPGVRTYDATKTAGKARVAQFQQEGFQGRFLGKVYGGKEGQERLASRWGGRFGVRGADLKEQEQFVSRSKREFDDLQKRLDIGQLSSANIRSGIGETKANTPKGYAYRRMAAKMGILEPEMTRTTLKELLDNPSAIKDFGEVARQSKFSNLKGKVVNLAAGEGEFSDLEGSQYTSIREEAYKHVQSDAIAQMGLTRTGQIKDGKAIEKGSFEKGVELMGGHQSKVAKDFMKDVGENRPDLTVHYTLNNSELFEEAAGRLAKINPGVEMTKDEVGINLYQAAIKDAGKVAKFPFDQVWDDILFQKALVRQLNRGTQKSRGNFITSVEKSLRSAYDPDRKLGKLREIIGGGDVKGGKEILSKLEKIVGGDEEPADEGAGGEPDTGPGDTKS